MTYLAHIFIGIGMFLALVFGGLGHGAGQAVNSLVDNKNDLAVPASQAGQWQSAPVPAPGKKGKGKTLTPTPDPSTFETFNWNAGSNSGISLSKDASHVWYEKTLVPGIDPSTAEPVIVQSGTWSDGQPSYFVPYIKDATQVWYPDFTGNGNDGTDNYVIEVVQGADPNTFTDIGGYRDFGEDASHVYAGTTTLSNDPAHFQSAINAAGAKSEDYYKDSQNVYDSSTLIQGADPSTFVALFDTSFQDGEFAKDQNHVYLGDTVFEGADPSTFDVVPTPSASTEDDNDYYFYVKDAEHVWFVDPNDFDKTLTSELSGADAASFAVIGGGVGTGRDAGYYATDVHHVYYDGTVLAAADPASFVVQTDAYGDAHDSAHDYIDGVLQNGDLYARDNNLYWHGSLVAGDIPASLGLTPSSLGQAPNVDENGNYGFGYEEGYWPFGQSGKSGTLDVYSSLATSTDGSLAAFIYTRESGPVQPSGYTDVQQTYATVLVYSATGLKDSYNLNLATFNPGLLSITNLTDSSVELDQGSGKCGYERYSLSIPDNVLTDLGSPPVDCDGY